MTAGEFRWDPQCLGQRSHPIVHQVTAPLAAAFRAAVDPGAVGSPCPPTLPVRFQTLDVPGLTLPTAGVIHASQEFRFPAGRPLQQNEQVRVVGWLESVRQRGRLAIVVVVNHITASSGAAAGVDGADDLLLVETRTTVMVTLPDEGGTQ